MTNQDFLDNLHKDFPSHIFKLVKMPDPYTFEVKDYLAIDGTLPSISWIKENISSETEKVIYEALTNEVMLYFLQHQGKT